MSKEQMEVTEQYNVVCERIKKLSELDEQTIMAILILSINGGVSREKVEDAYSIGFPILDLLLAPLTEEEK